MPTTPVQVLLISAPAEPGKSTLGWEIAAQLRRLGIAHVLLDSDELDQAWPLTTAERDQPGSPVTGRARADGNVMICVRRSRSATNRAAARDAGMEAVA